MENPDCSGIGTMNKYNLMVPIPGQTGWAGIRNDHIKLT